MMTRMEFERCSVRGTRWEIRIPHCKDDVAIELFEGDYWSIYNMDRESHKSYNEAESYLFRRYKQAEKQNAAT